MKRVSVARRVLLSAPLSIAGTAALAQPRSLVDIGQQGWLFPVWDRLQRLDVPAFRETLQIISEAIIALRGGRMDVVICCIPSRAKLVHQFMPAGMRIAPDIERRYAQASAEMRRAGALVPDLETRFQQAVQAQPNLQLFFKTDTHWTPIGAEVAAVEIAKQMREQLGMPPSPRPGLRLGELRRMVMAGGNLVQYVPANRRAEFASEESWIRQILPSEGPAALVEDDSADVVIVGTSNVQPRFGFQPVLSNQLLRPVALSWKPNNQGPYFAMLEYLKSLSFRQQRPRAIVWNLLEQDLATPPNNSAWNQSSMANNLFISEIRRLVGA